MNKPKNSPRHKARELVLKSLYAKDCGTAEPDNSFQELLKDVALPEKQMRFASELFDTCLKHSKWADEQIARLAKNWHENRQRLFGVDSDQRHFWWAGYLRRLQYRAYALLASDGNLWRVGVSCYARRSPNQTSARA